ncbi:MAG: N-6 DNA methylase [Bacteroidetes bacterium]|nr:N-6 DNA methylase [Bacteroidota bacterium]MCL6103621.1 N-6 DNA methylase [Bacteroidota bacterium]
MITKEAAFQKISELVERFGEQFDSYKNVSYNETLTRRDFIDPFFKALGWDIDNEQGYAEAYREVIHEDRVKIGKATKAPDYSFRLSGGKRLFFVEAKKPSVVIKDDILPAYQVRRYGWNAKLAISIITDFEEFAIYDCTRRPNPTDKASVARIEYLTFREYLPKFDFIWDTFSKERVLKGSFDKFVQGNANKRGTATVDKEFLISLDTWRTYLATSISWNNKSLDEDEINFVVQQTLDRIIFLRIAEDRGIEPYGNLQNAVKQGDSYQNMFAIFGEADAKYNSGLFDFKKDKLSKDIKIDNKVIKTIIKELYYPESPYEFSILAVEILGSAYEQFLGKVIRITPGHHAKIEEKPEVRKAGGVYYTPQYVVEYIVKNTVGKLVEGKTPKEISEIKIVDPACGSGSFLIGAYQYLLDWHKNYYTENGTLRQAQGPKNKKDNPLTPEGNLTTAEKKRILLNNIYGVDIDVNAVEVTKLSLLLKCMEGETDASIAYQLSIFHERVLPTLDNNIKSGNSLVDNDFYGGELDFGEEKKVKPFSWIKGFPEVFNNKGSERNQVFLRHFNRVMNLSKETDDLIDKYALKEPESPFGALAGFDVVIGNPPYGALFSMKESAYFKSRYNSAVWRGESYLLFIEQALKLLKKDGFLGFIVPDTLLNLGFTQPTRELLLRNSKLQEIVGLPSNVFSGATVDTIILLTGRTGYASHFNASNILVKTFGKRQPIQSIQNPQKEFYAKAKDWFDQNAFNIHTDNSEIALLSKIEFRKKCLSDISEMYSGIKVYSVGRGIPVQTEEIRNSKPYTSETPKGEDWSPFYDGKHIGRYNNFWKNNNWVKYGSNLAEPRNAENFKGEKLLIRKITGKTLISTYVPDDSYCNTLLHVLKVKDKSFTYKSILAILNSTLIGWYYKKKFQISDDDTFPQIMIRDILQFPIPAVDGINDAKLNKLVAQLLQLNEEKSEAKLQSRVSQLESKIDYCEGRINEIVYQLYDLTEDEIKIVENKK